MNASFENQAFARMKLGKKVLWYGLSLWIAVILISAFSVTTYAQEITAKKPSKADQAAAKKAYIEARKLYNAEEFGLALPLFEKAYTLSGRKPVSILALAQCERALKLYDRAHARLLEYRATQTEAKQIKRTDETLKILVQLMAKAKEEAKQEKKRKAEEQEAIEIALVKKLQAEANLRPPPSPPVVSAAPVKKAKSDSLFSSPWFWIGIAVVAAAGTGVGIMVDQTSGPNANYSNTGVSLEL